MGFPEVAGGRGGSTTGPRHDVRVRPHSYYVHRLRRSHLRADFHRHLAGLILPRLDRGWFVDVGCGPGLLEERVRRGTARGKMVGVDIDRRMLEIARAEQSIEVVLASSAFLPFRTACIEVVASSASLKDWRRPREGMLEIARIVSARGVAYVYDFITTGPGSRPPGFLRRYGLLSGIFRTAMGHFAPFSVADAQRLAGALTDVATVEVQQLPNLGVVGIHIRGRGAVDLGDGLEAKPRVATEIPEGP